MNTFKKAMNNVVAQSIVTLSLMAVTIFALVYVAGNGLGSTTWAGLALIGASAAAGLFAEHYVQPRDAPYGQILWRWASMGLAAAIFTLFVHVVFPGYGALHVAVYCTAMQLLLIPLYLYLERK